VDRPVYAEDFARELEENRAEVGTDELEKLLHGGDTWTVT
jgi:hypothetical protein